MALSIHGRQNVDVFLPSIAARVAQKLAPDVDIIDLATAENWLMRKELLALFNTALREQQITSKDLSYMNGFAGPPELLQALSSFFNEYFEPRLRVLPSHLTVASGASTVLDALLFSICNAGDSVMIMAPYWNGIDFQFTIRQSVKAVPVPSSIVEGIDPSIISTNLNNTWDCASTTSPIKALLLCNPHNPLGQCYSREILNTCLRFCKEKDIHFISDEIYALSVFASPHSSAPNSFESVLGIDLDSLGVNMEAVHTIWSVSKDFGCSGLRLGCLISQNNQSLSISAALASMNQVSVFSSKAITSLLTAPKSVLDNFIVTNRQRLSTSYAILSDFFASWNIRFVSASAGLYIWAKLDEGVCTWEAEETLWKNLNRNGVGVSAGHSYHAAEPGWFRITFAMPEGVLRKALQRIEVALELQNKS